MPADAPTRRYVFIVGPSRSGTSAFARLLGRHGRIVMGMERYVSLPAAQLTGAHFRRAAFLDPDQIGKGTDRTHYAEQAAKFDDALWIGDKVPRWIFEVDALKARIPKAAIFCMLREPSQVGHSYERKAATTSRDGYWRGQSFETGVEAAMRVYRHADALLRRGEPKFYMVDYDRIFGGDPAELEAVLSRLMLEPDERILDYYAKSHAKSLKLAERPRPMDEARQAVLDQLVDPDLIARLRRRAIRPAEISPAEPSPVA